MNDYKGKNSIHSQHLILLTLILIRKKNEATKAEQAKKKKYKH